jgi:polysaccharide export outer membrane protein
MMTSAKRMVAAAGLCLLSVAAMSWGQEAVNPVAPDVNQPTHDTLPISVGDIVSVRIYDVPELDQGHLRVTDAGDVPLVFLGPTKIQGLTPGQAAQLIAAAYTEKNLIRNGHATLTVDSYASLAVTVFGYVNGGGGASALSGTTGTSIPVSGPRPLLTILSMAGGLSDRASHTITIQRRDPSIKPFTVLVPNDAATDMANDPMINPGDIVVVPRAGIVYILGNVGHPSGVVMSEDGQITLMQALSQAGSTLPTSAVKNLMIFRKTDGQYQKLPVNLDKIVKGKQPDLPLEAQDVVWVPFSYARNIVVNGASIISALSSATAQSIIYTH